MKCPECCTELVVKDFPNLRVELDVCDSCNGLWFDPSELLKSIVKINDKTFEPPAVFLENPRITLTRSDLGDHVLVARNL